MDAASLVSNFRSQVNTELDAFLLDFFGDMETFILKKDLYVLEMEPPEVLNLDDRFEGGHTTFKFSQKYRLRLKTPQELDRERTDAILKKNSIRGKCIVCEDNIMGDEAMVETIHGLYHGAPRLCLNGRPDSED